jgi:hypothetical protein
MRKIHTVLNAGRRCTMAAKVITFVSRKEWEEKKKRKESIKRLLAYAKTLKW